ncbi:MAG: 50S ribosomal protein L10 [Armatimonadota bacterium]
MSEIPTEEKKQMVREMRERLQEAQSVYLTCFEGLTVTEANDLRGQLIDAGGEMQVVKNRLLMIAVEGTQYESLRELLTGPNALTYCGEDPIEPLKVLTQFAEEHEQPPVKAGVVEGERLAPEEIERLAKVPSPDQLMAEVVGAFAAPVRGLLFTLNAVLSDLVFTLQAIAEERGEDAA